MPEQRTIEGVSRPRGFHPAATKDQISMSDKAASRTDVGLWPTGFRRRAAKV